MKPSPDFLQQIALLLEQEPAAALSVEQRQRERRQLFARRKGFDPSQFFVAPISYRDAFDFVTTHHYSGSFVMDIVRLGMFQDRPFRKPKLVGVAIFGLGAGPKTLKKYLGSLRPLELVRFVLLDDVGYRGETWFLARAFEIIRSSSVQKEALAHHGGRYLLDHPVEGVLAFSDPVPRTTASGRLVMPGHVGSIYQSKSGIYAGRGEAHKTNILMPDGSVIDKRQQSKLTSQETGAETVYLKLVQAGARPKRPIESWAAWLGDIKRRPPFRIQVHPGTHAFVWKLAGKRRSLRAGDYPPGHRRPATVAERHSLVEVIRKLEQMERRAKGVEKAWLESEIVELKERLAGLELVRPENWPGYPKKVDQPQVLKGRKNRHRFPLASNCIEMSGVYGSRAGELVRGMVAKAVPITYGTMTKRTEVAKLAHALGYDRHLPLSRDWHVSYFKSTLLGEPVYFMRWSGIEYVFTSDGTCPDRSGQINRRSSGVILFSGGLDSVMLALLLKRKGQSPQPVYMSHRGNVGNVTKKELKAASKLARSILGKDLLIVKAPAKGKEPSWYGQYGDVVFSKRLPVEKANKDQRNRVFLRVLKDLDLAGGPVALGLLDSEATPKNRKRWADIRTPDLERFFAKLKTRGDLITLSSLGYDNKVEALEALGRRGKIPAQLWSSESCLMYFNKPCGDCASCKARAEAFLAAWGEDKTPYRPKSVAGKMKRKGRANRTGRRYYYDPTLLERPGWEPPQPGRHFGRWKPGGQEMGPWPKDEMPATPRGAAVFPAQVNALADVWRIHPATAQRKIEAVVESLVALGGHTREVREWELHDRLHDVHGMSHHGGRLVRKHWATKYPDASQIAFDTARGAKAAPFGPGRSGFGFAKYREDKCDYRDTWEQREARGLSAYSCGPHDHPKRIRSWNAYCYYFTLNDKGLAVARDLGWLGRKGQRYYYDPPPDESSDAAALRNAKPGDTFQLVFPEVAGAPRRKWMEPLSSDASSGAHWIQVVKAPEPGPGRQFTVEVRTTERTLGIRPYTPHLRARLTMRPGFGWESRRGRGKGWPDALDALFTVRNSRGHPVSGHPFKLLPLQPGRSPAKRKSSPAKRKSSPAKRAKVAGEAVDTIPLKRAVQIAKLFAQNYLATSEETHKGYSYLPEVRQLSKAESVKFSGSEDLAYATPKTTMVLAGSARRGDENIGDLDFVVVADEFPETDSSFMTWVSGGDRMRTYRFRLPVVHPDFPEILAWDLGAVGMPSPPRNWPTNTAYDVQVNLMRADPGELGGTLLYATGPGGWNAMMRVKAKRRGLKLNRYGLFEVESGEKVAGKTEKSIFKAMGKAFKAPWERGK